MNERIRCRIMRGKLPEIKHAGSERLDIPAILAQKKKLSTRPQCMKGRAYDSN
jgi:hypothetical protein